MQQRNGQVARRTLSQLIRDTFRLISFSVAQGPAALCRKGLLPVDLAVNEHRPWMLLPGLPSSIFRKGRSNIIELRAPHRNARLVAISGASFLTLTSGTKESACLPFCAWACYPGTLKLRNKKKPSRMKRLRQKPPHRPPVA